MCGLVLEAEEGEEIDVWDWGREVGSAGLTRGGGGALSSAEKGEKEEMDSKRGGTPEGEREEQEEWETTEREKDGENTTRGRERERGERERERGEGERERERGEGEREGEAHSLMASVVPTRESVSWGAQLSYNAYVATFPFPLFVTWYLAM